MPYRPRRKAAVRRRRPARKSMRRGNRRYAPGALRNFFKYKRFCEDSTLINTEPGVVKWVNAQSGWTLGAITPDDNGLYQFGGVMKFQLDDVINSTDFSQLYDRYKITGAKITFVPLCNTSYGAVSSTGNSQTGVLPTIITAIDYDDSTAPSSSMELLEKMDAKTYRLDKPMSIYIRSPKTSSTVNAESGPVSAAIGRSGWLNCANDDVNFRGFKFYVRDMFLPSADNLNTIVRIHVKYYLSFKDPQ